MELLNIQNQINLPDPDSIRRRLAPINSIRDGMPTDGPEAIQYAAEAFESYFIQMMLREMRRTVPDDQGFIPKSQAERIFTEMLDEEIAKEAARAGSFGLADTIVRQMTMQSYAVNMR